MKKKEKEKNGEEDEKNEKVIFFVFLATGTYLSIDTRRDSLENNKPYLEMFRMCSWFDARVVSLVSHRSAST